MNLTSVFRAVTSGRFRSADGKFSWLCPLCDGHVETDESSHDRDRRALLHYVYHQRPPFSEVDPVATSPARPRLMDTRGAGVVPRGALP